MNSTPADFPPCPDDADVTLTTPADLVSAIPYLVGYCPTDSLVLVGLDGPHIVVTIRFDLPESDQPALPRGVSREVLRRNNVRAAVVAGYGQTHRVTRSVDQVRRLLTEENIELVEALRITEGRYWSYTCTEPACCPPEGNAVNPTDSPVDAAFVAHGMSAAPDRSSVASILEPADPDTVSRVAEALARRFDLLQAATGSMAPAAVLASAAEDCADGRFPDVELTAHLAWMLTRSSKSYIAAMRFVDAGSHRGGLDLWIWLTRHLAGAQRAIAAAVTAYAAWRIGRGVLAAEAVHHALRQDPRCCLAMTMARLLNDGIPPSAVPALPSEAAK